MNWYRNRGKRCFDLALTAPAVLLFAPVLLAVALAVRLDSPGPVLFRQRRAGRGGRPFELLKFRTMTDRPRAVDGEVLANHPELTGVGRLLRRFKIDEMPQLLNVLAGEMSLVGPRPGLVEQIADYDEFGHQRLLVRPGLTGLAQIRGNIHLPWPERWRHDAEYVDTLSFVGDLVILVRTVAVILLGEERFLRRPGKG